jgi:hypothetical protein
MFYKAIGYVVWKFAFAYVRQRYGKTIRNVAIAGIATAVVGAFLARRSGE